MKGMENQQRESIWLEVYSFPPNQKSKVELPKTLTPETQEAEPAVLACTGPPLGPSPGLAMPPVPFLLGSKVRLCAQSVDRP